MFYIHGGKEVLRKSKSYICAISDFMEYLILDPDGFAEFTGFTEEEVKRLCERHGMSFEDTGKWYDGYDFPHVGSIYNPYSVMQAMKKKRFDSYWQKTSAAESLMTYINMDIEGLQEIIARLIAGEEIEVRTSRFANDLETFKSKDDVLTLLIHLGYLTWNSRFYQAGDYARCTILRCDFKWIKNLPW